MYQPKKILIAFFGDLYLSPRNTRFFNMCREQGDICDVVCYGIKGKDMSGINKFEIIANKAETFSWRLVMLAVRMLRAVLPGHKFNNSLNGLISNFKPFEKMLCDNTYDLIYVSDLYLLPVALANKKNSKILFDAREYYPNQNDESFFFRLFDRKDRYRVCKKYLSQADRVITVSSGIADKYKEEFGIHANVILSAPYYCGASISNEIGEVIKIVYHGMANRNRKIENMIDIFRGLTIPAEFHLYMVGDTGYIKELETLALQDKEIFFHEPIAPELIVQTMNKYDIGFCFYEPTTFNVAHCLPNKFFEYIQARLVVAVGPSPEMKVILDQYDCGIVGESFETSAMVAAINKLSRTEINRLKQNADRAAHDLCFENELKKMKSIVLEMNDAGVVK